MDKMSYPKGLIRYTTERSIEAGLDEAHTRSHIFRPRILIYSGIMLALIVVFLVSLGLRNPLRMDIMRDRGALAREVASGEIENVYRVQIMNSAEFPVQLAIKVEGLPNAKILDSQGTEITQITVKPTSNLMLPLKVRVSPEGLHTGATPISIELKGQEINEASSSIQTRHREEKTTFILPR
jgi:polyferredoxin